MTWQASSQLIEVSQWLQGSLSKKKTKNRHWPFPIMLISWTAAPTTQTNPTGFLQGFLLVCLNMKQNQHYQIWKSFGVLLSLTVQWKLFWDLFSTVHRRIVHCSQCCAKGSFNATLRNSLYLVFLILQVRRMVMTAIIIKNIIQIICIPGRRILFLVPKRYTGKIPVNSFGVLGGTVLSPSLHTHKHTPVKHKIGTTEKAISSCCCPVSKNLFAWQSPANQLCNFNQYRPNNVWH